MSASFPCAIRHLGRLDYESVWQAMIDFTARRDVQTADELWFCEHPPIYTLGQAGKPEHRLADNGIPLLKTDRGGQITYHGPGQVVLYLLLDLNRRRLGVRELVRRIEQAVIDLLADFGVDGERLADAPGVYVRRLPAHRESLENRPSRAHSSYAKLAALGLRVRRGCSYHGLSLNVDMDLAPFSGIDPCGYAGLAVTQTRDLGITLTPAQAAEMLTHRLQAQLERA